VEKESHHALPLQLTASHSPISEGKSERIFRDSSLYTTQPYVRACVRAFQLRRLNLHGCRRLHAGRGLTIHYIRQARSRPLQKSGESNGGATATPPPPQPTKAVLTCPCPQQRRRAHVRARRVHVPPVCPPRRRVRPTAPYYARPNPAARPWIGHLVGGRARTLAKACAPSSVDRGCMTARPCALYSV
jgi:hypothetical protein